MTDKTEQTSDEEAELSKLDDGSEVEGESGDAEASDTRERDENGRFKSSKDSDDSEESGDKKTAVEKADRKKAAAEDEESEEGETDDPELGEAESEDKDAPEYRIRTLVEQRNKARGQVNALTQRVAELEKQNIKDAKKEEDATAKLKEELEGLYESVEDLRADGKAKDAARAQRRIDEIRGELSEIRQTAKARQEAFLVAENREYDRMIDYLEAVRPIVKEGSEDFDQDTVNELQFQIKAYEAAGLSPTKALRRACALLFVEDPFAPSAKSEESAKGAKTEKTTLKKTTDVKKNLDAAKKQPAVAERSETGDRGKKVDVSKLSDEEFAALPKSKLAELGGDFI
jgi:hypothetical protein